MFLFTSRYHFNRIYILIKSISSVLVISVGFCLPVATISICVQILIEFIFRFSNTSPFKVTVKLTTVITILMIRILINGYCFVKCFFGSIVSLFRFKIVLSYYSPIYRHLAKKMSSLASNKSKAYFYRRSLLTEISRV